MKFVKASAIMNWHRFKEYADILETESIYSNNVPSKEELEKTIFVSHRWISKDNPDPNGRQLFELKQRIESIIDENDKLKDSYIFYDYCSINQNLTKSFEELTSLKEVINNCAKFIILSEGYIDYKNRSWCFYELTVAKGNIHLFDDQMEINNDLRFRGGMVAGPDDLGVLHHFNSGLLNYDIRYEEVEAVICIFQHLKTCKVTNQQDTPLIKQLMVEYFNSRGMTPFGTLITGVVKFFDVEFFVIPTDSKHHGPIECIPFFDSESNIRLQIPDRPARVFNLEIIRKNIKLSKFAIPISKNTTQASELIPVLRITKPGVDDYKTFIEGFQNDPDWEQYVVPPFNTIRTSNRKIDYFPTIDHVVHTMLEVLSFAGSDNCLYLFFTDFALRKYKT